MAFCFTVVVVYTSDSYLSSYAKELAVLLTLYDCIEQPNLVISILSHPLLALTEFILSL